MNIWYGLLAAGAAVLLIMYTFRLIKKNPSMFSSENISKSFFSVGVLTLIIFAVIAVCVAILRYMH